MISLQLFDSDDSEDCNNRLNLLVYSEEVLLLPLVFRMSWLGCVHSWEARSHIK